jgi:hypothetical protein
MGTFLDSLSKSTVETALHVSEVVLLLGGLLLLVGIWGEYRKKEKWKKYLGAFQIMVLAGIGVELLGDAGVFLFSESLQRLEGADIQALDKKARDAGDKATDALSKSGMAMGRSEAADTTSKGALTKLGKAERSAGRAMDLARGARQEADTFETRLGSAEHKADEAESHVTEAVRRATEATEALNRVRLPRELTHIPELATTLRPFKDTEYTFASVFADDESMQLLKQIEGMLQLAGWKRLKVSNMNLGIPAFQISGRNDIVNMGAYTGIHISVDSSETLEALQALPVEKLPTPVRIALLLNEGIFSNLSPPEDTKDNNRVEIESGTSKVIRIMVGKKP